MEMEPGQQMGKPSGQGLQRRTGGGRRDDWRTGSPMAQWKRGDCGRGQKQDIASAFAPCPPPSLPGLEPPLLPS